MMTKHRMGRVQLPWANLEPPIRSPNYYKDLEKRKEAGGRTDGEKSRRGRSVDLGSVSIFYSDVLYLADIIQGRCSDWQEANWQGCMCMSDQ